MNTIFSKLAVYKLEKLCEYLTDEFSENSKTKFIQKLNSNISRIEKNPELFPSSNIDKTIRKCVITKQTAILYEVHEHYIHVLNLIDNRQDKQRIHEEIKKHFG